MSAVGFKTRVDPLLVYFLVCVQLIPQIHPGSTPAERSQHGNRAILIHIPADMSAGIGGGSGLKPMTIHTSRSKYGAVRHFMVYY